MTPMLPTIELSFTKSLVRRRREPVAAGRGDVLDEGHHRHVPLGGKRADAVVDERRLRGRAARRVDLERHRLEAWLAEGSLQHGARAFHADPPAEHAGPADHAGEGARLRPPAAAGGRSRASARGSAFRLLQELEGRAAAQDAVGRA